MNNNDIINYYNDCKKDYRLIWRLDKVWGMHYGYWEKGDKSLSKAILKMNDQILKHTDINEKSKVLDAGCGYCGTAMYIAESRKCNIEAITIVEEQVNTAKKVIKKKNLEQYINVSLQDYTCTNFRDNEFDVIYAIESICHSEKTKFLKEAYRILKPSGTLIILDGFNSKEKKQYTKQEFKILQNFNYGWALNSLETGNFFIEESNNVGFTKQKFINITDNVMMTSKILHLASYPAVFVDFLGRLLRIRTKYNKGNVMAAKYQYIGMKKRLWEYGIFIAKK